MFVHHSNHPKYYSLKAAPGAPKPKAKRVGLPKPKVGAKPAAATLSPSNELNKLIAKNVQ